MHLTELWLGKNKIRALQVGITGLLGNSCHSVVPIIRFAPYSPPQNLDTFANLKILSIQSNRITKMEGLEHLVNLEELYLSHNGLTKIEGLEKNVRKKTPFFALTLQLKLRTLDVGNNMISVVEGISHLTQLEEFWVRV